MLQTLRRAFGYRKLVIKRAANLLWPFSRARTDWMVHATVDEPAEILAAFCAHYIALGASEVHLCLDRPQPHIVKMFEGKPKIRLTLCDDEYWSRTKSGRRPIYHVERQIHNANAAYRAAKTKWFLFCDADEFLFVDTPVASLLAAVPTNLNFIRVHVTERIFPSNGESRDIFDGMFRDPIIGQNELLKDIYKGNARFLDYGVVGHSIGKSFTRTGCILKIGLHFPHVPKRKGIDVTYPVLMKKPEYAHFLENALICHFISVTEFEYCLRLLRKYVALQEKSGLGNPVVFPNLPKKRVEAMQTVYDCRTDAALLRSFLLSVAPDQSAVDRLCALGKCKHLPTASIAVAANKMFPGASLDFSVKAADRKLRERYSALIEETGFAL